MSGFEAIKRLRERRGFGNVFQLMEKGNLEASKATSTPRPYNWQSHDVLLLIVVSSSLP